MNRITAIVLTLSLLIGGSIVAPPTTRPAHSATQEYWRLVTIRNNLVQECWQHLKRLKDKRSPGYERSYLQTTYLFNQLGKYTLEQQIYLLTNQVAKLAATR